MAPLSIDRLLEWIRDHEVILGWLAALSIATFAVTLIIVPLLVSRIPPDYFTRDQLPPDRHPKPRSVGRFLGRVLKNLLGLIFIAAGLAMLVLPGQGLITLLLGIMLVDFPGKLPLERHFMRQPTVFRTINWIRTKANQPALEMPEQEVKKKRGEGSCRIPRLPHSRSSQE